MSAPTDVVQGAVDRLQPLFHASALAWWDANVDATEEHEQRRVAAELALSDALADAELFDRVSTARTNGADGTVRRELDLLHASLLPNQVPAELRHRIVELEAKADADIQAGAGRVSDELRNEIARYASRAADQVVEQSLDEHTQQRLIEDFIARVGAGS